MHILGLREKGSKVYPANIQCISINNDNEHKVMNQNKIEVAKQVYQRKKIDKMLHSMVKQRLFGNFLSEDYQLSLQNTHNLDNIYKSRIGTKMVHFSRDKHPDKYDLRSHRPSLSQNYTIECSRTTHQDAQGCQPRKRNFSQRRLPKISKTQKKSETTNKGHIYHQKKLDINQKEFSKIFREWANANNSQLVYEIKITRQNIISKYRNIIDRKCLQRFFHFFGFPLSFGLRQFCNILENAANCNLKFIHFWIFSLFDENSNGIITSQDLFQFIQKFMAQIPYVEKQIYQIQKYLEKIIKNFKPKQDNEIPIDQILVANHNLKLQELKILLKQSSNKQSIDVNCVKNTCYHQTLLSLEHDARERIKNGEIENSELATKKLKEEAKEAKTMLKNTPGLRLRDFYAIYGSKRPKIFCYFLNLLANVNASDYQ